MEKPLLLLREGKPARSAQMTPEEMPAFRTLQLLTSKPVVYVCNVEESAAAEEMPFPSRSRNAPRPKALPSSSFRRRSKSEFSGLAAEDRDAFLNEMGLKEPGLNRLIRAGYALFGSLTYFTVGPKEARAWTITRGTKAPQAAGVIHTDFEKGFIRAETIAYQDYVAGNGEAGAKDAGKMRLEGKDYVVQDGDVMHFRFAN